MTNTRDKCKRKRNIENGISWSRRLFILWMIVSLLMMLAALLDWLRYKNFYQKFDALEFLILGLMFGYVGITGWLKYRKRRKAEHYSQENVIEEKANEVSNGKGTCL